VLETAEEVIERVVEFRRRIFWFEAPIPAGPENTQERGDL